jgi:hypothetical protein
MKCAPPLREEENRFRLLDGLRDGVIDSVATDHSPSGGRRAAPGAALPCCGARALALACLPGGPPLLAACVCW